MVKCAYEPCPKEAICRGFCNQHYRQILHEGKISEKRTMFDKNEIVIEGNIARIFLYNCKGIKHFEEAIIDSEDVERVKNYKWCLKKKGKNNYAWNRIVGYLQNFIMNFVPTNIIVIDHINGNGLDNRRCNLRICTQSQNCMNTKVFNTNTSNHKGVSWHKHRKKWRAFIMVDYKQISLGYFFTKEEAVEARKEGEKNHHGEFVRK